MTEKFLKVDLHCHILPERWPDLKEVRLFYFRWTFVIFSVETA